jgi:hypothetical protein
MEGMMASRNNKKFEIEAKKVSCKSRSNHQYEVKNRAEWNILRKTKGNAILST